MKRPLLVALFVALLVVQPATAAGYPSAEDACAQTDGRVVVAIFPGASDLQANDSQVVTGETTVYPGTTFRVAFCKNGELMPTHGSEWSLESTPGLNESNPTERTVTVRVTGEENRIDVSGLVKNKDLQGVSVVVPSTPTVDSALTDETIRFENRTAAAEYEDAEARYLAALANLSNATDRLNESAAALDSGEGNPEPVTAEVLPALNESEKTVDARTDELETRLYETAWRSDRDSNALAALSVVQRREQVTKAETKHAMENYLGSLKTAERDAYSTVLVNFGVAGVLGLVAGAVPGWWLTERKLEGIRFDQEVNSRVSGGPGVLARAVALAAVALVLTVAALAALGGLGTLGGLL